MDINWTVSIYHFIRVVICLHQWWVGVTVSAIYRRIVWVSQIDHRGPRMLYPNLQILSLFLLKIYTQHMHARARACTHTCAHAQALTLCHFLLVATLILDTFRYGWCLPWHNIPTSILDDIPFCKTCKASPRLCAEGFWVQAAREAKMTQRWVSDVLFSGTAKKTLASNSFLKQD